MPIADVKVNTKAKMVKGPSETEHFDLEETLENMISRLTEAFEHSFGGISNEKEIGRNTIAISEEIRKLAECLMMVRGNEIHSGAINIEDLTSPLIVSTEENQPDFREGMSISELDNCNLTKTFDDRVKKLAEELLSRCRNGHYSSSEIRSAVSRVEGVLGNIPLK